MPRSTPAAGAACGLDIGSNTFTCAELARRADGSIAVVDDASIAVRLSEGLTAGGQLKDTAIERGLAAITELIDRFDLSAKPRRAVATQVLRMAREPQRFTEPASTLLGIPIEIVDGEAEALLVSRGATLHLGAPGPWIVVDVGGQSTEICWQQPDGAWSPLSLPIGVVGLTERFATADPPGAAQLVELRRHVRGVLAERVPPAITGELIGVAGTATTLGWLERGLDRWERDAVHGTVIDRDRLAHWTARMTAIGTAERSARYGLGAGRADVFPAGLCLMDELLSHLGRTRFVVSVNGLRVGVALTLLED